MSEVVLVTATCGQCGGRLKGYHYDHQPAESGDYVHITVGPAKTDEHRPVAESVRLTDYELWHALNGIGW